MTSKQPLSFVVNFSVPAPANATMDWIVAIFLAAGSATAPTTSDIDIINLALTGMLGENPITSLDDYSHAPRACNVRMPSVGTRSCAPTR